MLRDRIGFAAPEPALAPDAPAEPPRKPPGSAVDELRAVVLDLLFQFVCSIFIFCIEIIMK